MRRSRDVVGVARTAMTSQSPGTNLGVREGLGSNSRFRPGAPVLRERLGARDNFNLQDLARQMRSSSKGIRSRRIVGSSEVELHQYKLFPGLSKPAIGQ